MASLLESGEQFDSIEAGCAVTAEIQPDRTDVLRPG
jgi:hypothetical protein